MDLLDAIEKDLLEAVEARCYVDIDTFAKAYCRAAAQYIKTRASNDPEALRVQAKVQELLNWCLETMRAVAGSAAVELRKLSTLKRYASSEEAIAASAHFNFDI